MPNGKIGDHPITDMLVHGKHPFPADMEELIWQLHAANPKFINELGDDPFYWEKGWKRWRGRRKLKELLAKSVS